MTLSDGIERLLAWLGRERFEIGRAGDVYLTRWTLLGRRFGGRWRVFLHRFHRSDSDGACHDHPWPFVSVILWGGYWEHVPDPADPAETRRRWYWPGSVLIRPAEWRHRVEIPAGRRAWTVVWTGDKRRSWYFWCDGVRPVEWRQFVAREDAGRPGCE